MQQKAIYPWPMLAEYKAVGQTWGSQAHVSRMCWFLTEDACIQMSKSVWPLKWMKYHLALQWSSIVLSCAGLGISEINNHYWLINCYLLLLLITNCYCYPEVLIDYYSLLGILPCGQLVLIQEEQNYQDANCPGHAFEWIRQCGTHTKHKMATTQNCSLEHSDIVERNSIWKAWWKQPFLSFVHRKLGFWWCWV